jgi:hypothetical protein
VSTPLRPAVNARVDAVLAPGLEQPTRVEGYDGADLLVAPVSLDGAQSRDRLVLRWSTSTGAAELPLALVAREDGAVPVWRLRPVGEPRVEQRRAYVRAAALLPVQVTGSLGGHRGRIVDLSEGGARCVHVQPAVALVREHVGLAFDVDGVRLDLQGEVLRTTLLEDELVEFAVRFVDASHVADRLRRHVFACQLRARAVASR